MSTNCNIKWSHKKLYKHLRDIKYKIRKDYSPTYLYQSDFDNGTYIINQPGNYILKENIVFNPNPDNDWMPRSDQTQYSDHAYVLGFFAAISIKTSKFIIDLNGYSIKQSPEHALQQRFYSNIELGSSPFLPGQGPGNFATTFTPAKDGIICNGTLGRSSHHGIHGNNAVGILVEKVTIKDFEFVGSALNGGGCHMFRKVKVKDQFTDIPVLATYSAARFIRLFAKHLLHSDKLSQNQRDELQQKLDYLESSLDLTFREIIQTGSTTNLLFRNESRLPDGNSYGILFHVPGVAINNFVGSTKNYAKNVFLYKVYVKNLEARVDEIIGISNIDGTGVQVDTSGAVLQIDNITNSQGRYKGNVLSDLQIYLGKLRIELNVPLGTLNISKDVVAWSENGTDVKDILGYGYLYRTGADSMFHVNKGVIGYRFGGVKWLEMKKCCLYNVKNKGFLGNETISPSLKAQDDTYYLGAQSIGVSVSYCVDVVIYKFKLKKIKSRNGDITGIYNMNQSKKVKIDEVQIYKLKSGKYIDGEWRGINYYGDLVTFRKMKKNKVPQSVGIYVCKDCDVELGCLEIHKLCSPKRAEKIKYEYDC